LASKSVDGRRKLRHAGAPLPQVRVELAGGIPLRFTDSQVYVGVQFSDRLGVSAACTRALAMGRKILTAFEAGMATAPDIPLSTVLLVGRALVQGTTAPGFLVWFADQQAVKGTDTLQGHFLARRFGVRQNAALPGLLAASGELAWSILFALQFVRFLRKDVARAGRVVRELVTQVLGSTAVHPKGTWAREASRLLATIPHPSISLCRRKGHVHSARVLTDGMVRTAMDRARTRPTATLHAIACGDLYECIASILRTPRDAEVRRSVGRLFLGYGGTASVDAHYHRNFRFDAESKRLGRNRACLLCEERSGDIVLEDLQHVLCLCPLTGDLRGRFGIASYSSVGMLLAQAADSPALAEGLCAFVHRSTQLRDKRYRQSAFARRYRM
jgi:hypothetical protein